ncbi:MAG: phage tail protein [Planctomycetaceae bacterium]|nr:phage tail protein [Planctomycetaceae bacterium]
MPTHEVKSLDDDLILGFRFGVFFFTEGKIPNVLDTRFRKVSGISAEVRTSTIQEGGENIRSHVLPDGVDYKPLVLERGLPKMSILSADFEKAMEQFRFIPTNVLVTSLGDTGLPVAGWMFMNAWPVRWSVSDLDATSHEISIETLELTYSRMQKMRI